MSFSVSSYAGISPNVKYGIENNPNINKIVKKKSILTNN
jgi:hypothetical protein